LRAFVKVFAILILTMFLCFPASAKSYELYSETIQAMLERLEHSEFYNEGKEDKTDNKTIEQEEATVRNISDEQDINKEAPEQEEVPGEEIFENKSETFHNKPIYDSFQGSILKRIQKESTVSLEGVTEGVDKISTSFYNTITRSLIGLLPVLLVVGAVLVLFSKGRAIGIIMFVVFGIFVILNAPEIISMFLNFITGIFQ